MSALNVPIKNTYTHVVLDAAGRQFSIHHSEADAQAIADLYKGASVAPFTPNPTTYWDQTIGERYDH